MRRGLLIAAVLASVLAATPAFAHAMLETQTPRAGAVLTSAPAAVRLSFSEELRPVASGVTVTDEAGRSAAAGPARISGHAMALSLRVLAPGKYRVVWHAVSHDGHRTEGSYGFTVKP